MEREGIHVSRNDAYWLLQDCERKRDLPRGRRVQSLMLYSGLDSLSALGDHLIRIFSFHGSINEANQAFNKIEKPDAYTWAASILANAKPGQAEVALELHHKTQLHGEKTNRYIYLAALRASKTTKDILPGKLVHEHIIRTGFQSDLILGSALIDMYCKCGFLKEACRIFDQMPSTNIVSWNAMLAGYTQYGENTLAFECFENMQHQGLCLTEVSFLSILKACSSVGALEQGRAIHEKIIESGLQHSFLANSLVDMYGKCGHLYEAKKVFDNLQDRDVVSWGSIIAGYAQQGAGLLALKCFEMMQQEAVKANIIIYLSVIKACSTIKQLQCARFVHDQILEDKIQTEFTVANALIDMYAKGGSLKESLRVFNKLVKKDVVSWSAMIGGCSQHEEIFLALDCFEKMQQEGIRPNISSFLTILKACSITGAIEQGRLIHEQIMQSELHDITIGNTLIDMYTKCQNLKEAYYIFITLKNQDVVSWNAMITGYVQHGHSKLALECFEHMQKESISPNLVTYLSIVKACAVVGILEQGRLLHDKIIECEFKMDSSLGSSFVDMYAKCGSLEEARDVFDNVPCRDIVSWGAIIAGCAQHEDCFLAFNYFEEMQKDGIKPNAIIFSSLLKVCANVGALEQGMLVHDYIIKAGLEPEVVIGSGIVDMYVKCGLLEEANAVFSKLPNRNIVSWGTVIAGYAQHGAASLTLHYLEKMQQEGIKPNEVIFTSTLAAFGHVGLVDEGCWYFKSTTSHTTCMVHLLGRAGCFNEVECLLQDNVVTDSMTWTTLLYACKMYGNADIARLCFKQIVLLDSYCSASYVLMSHIYADGQEHGVGMLKRLSTN